MARGILTLLVVAAIPLLSCAAGIDRGNRSRHHLSVLMICFPASGHTAVPVAVGEELVRRGHNVTLFTVQPKDFDPSRKAAEKAGITYTSIDINASYEMFEQLLEEVGTGASVSKWLTNVYGTATKLLHLVEDVTRTTLGALDSPSLRKYDILLATEITSPLAMCLSKKWGVPLIVVSTTPEFLVHPKPSWALPGMGPLQSSEDLDFIGRLSATLEKHATSLLLPLGTKLTSVAMDCPVTASEAANGPGVSIPNIIPTVIGFEYPHPISPLTSYTGPILTSSDEPLSEDVQSWIDSRPVGSVVYINIDSSYFLRKKVAWAIVEGLYATGYNAVWNMKKKNRFILEGLEINEKKILLLEGAPQLTLLRHKSVRMAILHGGINDVQEALDSGVPLIVLPMSSGPDQWANAARVVHRRLGVTLDPTNLTGTQVAESIRIVEKGNYHDNVNKLRKIFRHAGGVSTAVDLVEFYGEVGYDHLIPAYVRYNWNWIQYYNVDVYALLLVVSVLAVWIMLAVCRFVYKECCRKKKPAKTKRE
eukprot:Em0004g788a